MRDNIDMLDTTDMISDTKITLIWHISRVYVDERRDNACREYHTFIKDIDIELHSTQGNFEDKFIRELFEFVEQIIDIALD
jgi:hypothetical protein